LSFVAEIGQASALFSLLLTDNKNKYLTWFVMIILTSLQVVGNVVSSYDWIIQHNSAGVDSFQQSILFWMTAADPQIFKVVIAWISGALLPIIALSMTALVAQNMDLKAHDAKTKLDDDSIRETIPETIGAKDLISEIAKVRPTTEELDGLSKFLNSKKPIEKPPVEDILGRSEEEIIRNYELMKEESVFQKKKQEGYQKTMDYLMNEDKPTEEKKSKVEWRVKDGVLHPDHQKFLDEMNARPDEAMRPEEPKEDEIPPEDHQLTDDEIMDQISEANVPDSLPHYSDEELYQMNLDEHERTGTYTEEDIEGLNNDLDAEAERLTYPVNHEPQIELLKNLVEDIKEKQFELYSIPETSPEPSQEVTPEPTPTKTEESKTQPLSSEQLEKIRKIAQDNLKKK
jgi:hypothetical protein